MFLETIFIELDTYHILKLLSSEQVTIFKRKVGISVTKLKVHVQLVFFCYQCQRGKFHASLAEGSQKRMITLQLIGLGLMSEGKLAIIIFIPALLNQICDF